MISRIAATAGVFAATCFAAPPSQAAFIFGNFAPGQNYVTTTGNVVGNAFDGSVYAEGNSFVSGLSAAFGKVTLALSCAANCPASAAFTVTLNASASDQPSAVLESFTVSGALLGALGNYNAPLVLNSVVHPLLTAGTQYWVTVSATLADSISWNLNSSGDTSDQAISADAGASWFSPSGLTPGAFQVDSVVAVPEPATAVTLALGLLVLALRARSAQRQRG